MARWPPEFVISVQKAAQIVTILDEIGKVVDIEVEVLIAVR